MTEAATAGLPKYALVTQSLADRVRTRHKPGDLLPTQSELAAEFDTSLITIKRALTELARRGLIESVRGRGTVVRRPVVTDSHAGVSSWTDTIAGLGSTPQTAWCRISARPAPTDVARFLGIKSRRKMVAIERLRLIDGEPICLMTNLLPLDVVPDLVERGLANESLYATLVSRYGVEPARADEEVFARAATPAERKTLALSGNIVLVINRRTFARDGRPIEIATVVAPADRYRYRVSLNGTS